MSLFLLYDTFGSGGFIRCAAIEISTKLTSVHQLTNGNCFSMPIYSPFRHTSHTHNLTLTNLVGSTSYNVYCYGEDSLGRGSSLSVVKSMSIPVLTPCCREIVFVNVPSVVSGDLSSYSKTRSNPNLYEFIFSIGSTPPADLIVTPILLDEQGANVSDIEAIPAFQKFTLFDQTSAQLRGSFVLSGFGWKNVTILLGLSGSNVSVGIYSSPQSISTRLSPAQSTIPPPAMKSVLFNKNGQGLNVLFSCSVDLTDFLKTVASDSWPCHLLFVFRNDSTTSCVWQSDTVVVATFSSSSLLPGNNLTLIGGIIRSLCPFASCDAPYSSSHTLVISRPPNVLSASPKLLFPDSMDSCGSLTIDTSLSAGHGGRDWQKVQWFVTPAPEDIDTSPILDALESSSSSLFRFPIIQVDAVALQSSLGNHSNMTLTISLGLLNFLEGESENRLTYSSKVITIFSNSSSPILHILGSTSLTRFPSEDITIKAFGRILSCVGTRPLAYEWLLYENSVPTAIKSMSNDPTKFYLPPYSLAPNLNYELLVRVTALPDGASSTAFVQIHVLPGTINIVVAGGCDRFVSPYTSLILDASSSFDTSSEYFNTSEYFFKWQCTYKTLSALFGTSCSDSVSLCDSFPSCSLPAFLLTPRDLLAITLSVSERTSVSDPRSSSRVINVEVGSVSSNLSIAIASSVLFFNVNEKLTIDAEITFDQRVLAHWDLISHSAIDLGASAFTLTAMSKSFPLPTGSRTSSVQFPLSIRADLFSPGREYTFKLSLTDSFGTIIHSSISLTSNGPPSGGSLLVSPQSGIALLHIFFMNALGWIDDDLPLLYAFKFSLTLDSVFLTIQLPSEVPSASSKFHQGHQSNDYRVYLSLSVEDVHGARTKMVTHIKVFESQWPATATQSTAELVPALPDSLALYDTDTVLRQVGTASLILNLVDCTSANSLTCSAKYHREGCTTTLNTCGNCQEGYIGIPTHSNTLCTPRESLQKRIGEACGDPNASCSNGFCNESLKVCTEHLKQCPFASSSESCSGHGRCVLRNGLRESLAPQECGITNLFCEAFCECTSGYGGAACQYDSLQLANRSETRTFLCKTVADVFLLLDPSRDSLDALIGLLVNTFVSSELNRAGYEMCGDSLLAIMELVETGYLSQLSDVYTSTLATLLSSFAQNSAASSTDGIVISALNSFAAGLACSMVAGQASVSVSVPSFALRIGHPLASDLFSARLTPPFLGWDGSSNQSAPMIVLPEEGLGACGSQSGTYSQFALLQWSAFGNPHKSVSGPSIITPVLEFASVMESVSTQVPEVIENASFLLVLTFNQPQHWNGTEPECVRLVDGEYYHSCNLTGFTPHNATFACFVSGGLCSSSFSTEVFNSSRRGGGRRMSLKGSQLQFSHYLATTRDTGREVDEYLVSLSQSSPSSWQFSFIAAIVSFLIFGYIFCAAWDSSERNYQSYFAMAKDRRLRTLPPISSLARSRAHFLEIPFRKSAPQPHDSVQRLVEAFFARVFNFADLTIRKTSRANFVKVLLRHHPWLRPFSFPSSRASRSTRFLNVIISVVLLIFLEALCYSVLYPNDEDCLKYSRTDCLHPTSRSALALPFHSHSSL
jgi:hypothetical protein